MRRTSIIENEYGKWWLGNLVNELGGDLEKYSCQGEITDYSLDGKILTINQKTVECEQRGVRKIIEEKFPSIKVYYIAEEHSLYGEFRTNDDTGGYFPERYYLDFKRYSRHYNTIESAAMHVSVIVGHLIEPNYKAVFDALFRYCKEREDEDPDIDFSFREVTVWHG